MGDVREFIIKGIDSGFASLQNICIPEWFQNIEMNTRFNFANVSLF